MILPDLEGVIENLCRDLCFQSSERWRETIRHCLEDVDALARADQRRKDADALRRAAPPEGNPAVYHLARELAHILESE